MILLFLLWILSISILTLNLRWTFKVLSGEDHRSTVYPTLFHGIQEYFENYRELSISSLEEFNVLGGMSYVKTYYKKRSEMYSIPNEMSTFTKYSLTRLAIKANNLEQFEIFLKEFEGTKFIETLRTSWACNVADFYVKNNENQKALELYQFIALKHPKSIQAQKGLGDTYSSLKIPDMAKKAYQKASELEE